MVLDTGIIKLIFSKIPIPSSWYPYSSNRVLELIAEKSYGSQNLDL